MRSILTDYWEETNGSGGLELSLDASEDVLSCVCEYIHSNILIMPVLLYPDQLDLVRIGTQLSMTRLVDEVTDFIISNSSNKIDTIEEYSVIHDLKHLQEKCISCRHKVVPIIDVVLNPSKPTSVKADRGVNTDIPVPVVAPIKASVADIGTGSKSISERNFTELDNEVQTQFQNASALKINNKDQKTGRSGEIYKLLLQNNPPEDVNSYQGYYEEENSTYGSKPKAAGAINIPGRVKQNTLDNGTKAPLDKVAKPSVVTKKPDAKGNKNAPPLMSPSGKPLQQHPLMQQKMQQQQRQRAVKSLQEVEYNIMKEEVDDNSSPLFNDDEDKDGSTLVDASLIIEYDDSMSLKPNSSAEPIRMTPAQRRQAKLNNKAGQPNATASVNNTNASSDELLSTKAFVPGSNNAVSNPSISISAKPASLKLDTDENTPSDKNIRSSLTLLKQKALNRRQSVSSADTLDNLSPVENPVVRAPLQTVINEPKVNKAVVQKVSMPIMNANVKCLRNAFCKCVNCVVQGEESVQIAQSVNNRRYMYEDEDDSGTDTSVKPTAMKQVPDKPSLVKPNKSAQPIIVESKPVRASASYDLNDNSNDDEEEEEVRQNPNTSIYETVGEYVEPSELRECPSCSRQFNPSAYERHIKICKKVFMTERKVFNAAEQRKIDDENLAFANQQAKAKQKKAKPAATSGKNEIPKWKLQSLQFRAAMKAAQEGGGGPEEEAIHQAAIDNLIPCPHCNRRFNETAAERHIPKCKDIRAKPTALMRGSSNGIGSVAVSTKSGVISNGRGGLSSLDNPSVPGNNLNAKYKIGNSR